MLTGIFKQPVKGPVRATGVNLEGDRQADLTVHGGADKAVYVYPAEHYPYWQHELGRKLPWGIFGENLTVEDAPLDTRSRSATGSESAPPSSSSPNRDYPASNSESASTTREWSDVS